MRVVLAAIVAIGTGACQSRLGAVPTNAIECARAADCPAELVCVVDVGRCQAAEAPCVEPSGDDYQSVADFNLCDLGTDQRTICIAGACVPSTCGDALVDAGAGEECDDGERNVDAPDACRTDCRLPSCGDGFVDSDEACDDGNVSSGDGCRADCEKIERCGDALIDAGEVCDDGNDNPNDFCANDCMPVDWSPVPVVTGGVTGDDPATLDFTGSFEILSDGNFVFRSGQDRLFWATAGLDRAVPRLGTPGGISAADGAIAQAIDVGASRDLDPTEFAVDAKDRIHFYSRGSIWRVGFDGRLEHIRALPFASKPTGTLRIGIDGTLYYGWSGQVFAWGPNDEAPRAVAGDADPMVDGSDADTAAALAIELRGQLRIDVDTRGNLLVGHYSTAPPAVSGLWLVETDGTAHQLVDETPAIGSVSFGPADSIHYAANDPTLVQRHRIWQTTRDGAPPEALAGGGLEPLTDGALALEVELGSVRGVKTAPDGRLWFTTGQRLVAIDGDRIRFLAGPAVPQTWPALSAAPALGAAAFAPDGTPFLRGADGTVYALDGEEIRPTGETLNVFERRVVYGPTGDRFVVSEERYRIERVGSGAPVVVAGTEDGFAHAASPLGTVADTPINAPRAMTASSESLYLFERLGQFNDNGTITPARNRLLRVPLSGPDAPCEELPFPPEPSYASSDASTVIAMTVDGLGRLYVAISRGQSTAVRLWRRDGTDWTELTFDLDRSSPLGACVDITAVSGAVGLAVDDTDRVFLAGSTGILRRDPDGTTRPIAGCSATGDSFKGRDEGGEAFYADATRVFSDIHWRPGGLTFLSGGWLREIDDSGTIYTLVGNALPGSGPLQRSSVFGSAAVTAGPNGVLWVDSSSGTVKAVQTGRVATRVGFNGGVNQSNAPDDQTNAQWVTAFANPEGIAFDAATGALFVSDTGSHVIWRVDTTDSPWSIEPWAGRQAGASHVDGDREDAQFNAPAGLAVYDDALWVADRDNHVVRRIELTSGTVSTAAGFPTGRGYRGDGGSVGEVWMDSPVALAFDVQGRLFVADRGNHRVRRLDFARDEARTVLGDGSISNSGEGAPASIFPVRAPSDLAFDPYGNLWVTATATVRQLIAVDGVVSGEGPVRTVYGAPPRDTYPEANTRCLDAIAFEGDRAWLSDACIGIIFSLERTTASD